MLQYVDHVHYVVHNRDAMVEYLEKNFGMKPDRLFVIEGKNKGALYDLGKTRIRIDEPLSSTSGTGKHLAKHGPGVYHVAWGVDDIKKVAQELVAKGNKIRESGERDEKDYLVCNIDPANAHGLLFQLIGPK